MKSTKRILALAVVLAVSVLIFAGCSQKGISVHVSIIGQEDAVLANQDVKVTEETPFAIDATIAAITAAKLEYEHDATGYISSIAGLASTDTDGWLFYINDEMAQLGANEQPIADGDTVEWKYLNYDAAFAG